MTHSYAECTCYSSPDTRGLTQVTGAATDEDGNAVLEEGDEEDLDRPHRFLSADEIGDVEQDCGDKLWPNFSKYWSVFQGDNSLINPHAKEAGDGRSYTQPTKSKPGDLFCRNDLYSHLREAVVHLLKCT